MARHMVGKVDCGEGPLILFPPHFREAAIMDGVIQAIKVMSP